MNRPVELRSPQQGWLKVLRLAYPFLREHSLGDLTVFGSQAMSVFMKTGLRSKDLDFLSAQMGPKHQDNLGKLLAGTTGIEVRSRTVQTKSLPKGEMKIYSIELRLEERPLIIEIFDKVLDGRPISLLAPHLLAQRRGKADGFGHQEFLTMNWWRRSSPRSSSCIDAA